MQTAHSAAVSALPTVTHGASTSQSLSEPPSRAKLSESTLDAFWRRMLGMYGHTWASAYGDAPTGTTAETWASCLAGVSTAQIADGLRACVAEGGEFPPSAPRFRAMCLGIPSLAVVRLEIRGGEHSPFTRAVWANLDSYRFRQSSADVADRILRDAYDLTREQVMRGQPLPAPSAAIAKEQREVRPAPPEVARAHLSGIAEILGVDRKAAAAGPDA